MLTPSDICIGTKNLPKMQETCVRSLGWEDTLVMRTPTPVFLPGEFHEHNSLSGYNPWGPKDLDTTEELSLSSGKTHPLPLLVLGVTNQKHASTIPYLHWAEPGNLSR